MSETLLKPRALPRAPVLATVLFALAYGSVMLLLMIPRGFLTGGPADPAAQRLVEAGAPLPGSAQVLRGGVTLPGSAAYGITD